jgi:hypothetical protein
MGHLIAYAMTDPHTPETTAWLDALPLNERLVILHAMAIAFPPLQRRKEWKARIEAATAVLRPTAEELDDILKAAGRRAERLKDEFAG